VFRHTPRGRETILHSFGSGSDERNPHSGLVPDPNGNFYGTTTLGGTTGHGTAFKLTPKGGETALYSFTGGSDGAGTDSGLVFGAKGNLYGTTDAGAAPCASGCGVGLR
jgi:uncharacterized repeat protein (TIGR03803 family)